ncbi:hypothetical protein BD779DRAFT_1673999 [Infundibulicybe gibba]|nr:hypothetical protein BD779DRAFT_1673999 [Infundibulicybe gibba]
MENLPVEITRTIFLELCSLPAIFPLEDEPRLLVTRVCSQWRAIALSTPALWADYYIHFSSFRQPPPPDSIRAWISRAAQSSLSFTFRGSARYRDTSFMIANLVIPVMHRCSLLSLHLNTAMLNRLLALPPSSFHTLQSVTFIIEDMSQCAASQTPFATAFESCPQLHTFSLNTIGRHYPKHLRILNFNVPWHQLTALRLCSLSILAHECLDILRRCASLQECGISISPIDDSLGLQRVVEYFHHPTVLPFLHTLYIKSPNMGDNNCSFLHAFHLPRLRKFQPRGSTYRTPWSLPMFQSVLSNTTHELNLSGFRLPESLSETVALVPNLEILWLGDGFHKNPGTMRALGEGTLSPRLTTLHLDSVESFDFLFDVLETRMAAARRGITALINVTILDRGDNPLDEARLMALMETGIRIRLGHLG